MEVAIPVIALGAMYVISNQDKRENFKQREPPYKKEQQLPNTNVPPVNYPVETYASLPQNVKYYENPNAATDKYYQQDAYETAINKHELKGSMQFQSLTGDIKPAKEIRHNNMVPFFGSHLRQYARCRVPTDTEESTGASFCPTKKYGMGSWNAKYERFFSVACKSGNEYGKRKTIRESKCGTRIKQGLYDSRKWGI